MGGDLTSGDYYSCGADMVRRFPLISGSKPEVEEQNLARQGWDVVECGIEARRGCERLREVGRWSHHTGRRGRLID